MEHRPDDAAWAESPDARPVDDDKQEANAQREALRQTLLAGVSAGIVAYPHPGITSPDDMFLLVEAALRRGRARSGERIGVAE